ncbi:SRPBCC family protein [Streptomyces sp. NBC_00727]|uniref:SRPBCC family protein n=1 Tax=Streptomyces sp. NBC_00727 TaxID=2903675 RepID=UPI00386F38C3
MAQVEATTERIIAADAEAVFDALADYKDVRGKVLPAHFSEYEVREGGDGEGTLVHWKLQATSKRVRDCLLDVTEPTGGTSHAAGYGGGQLVEKDRNSSMVTTWTVTPAGEGRSKAVVTTVWDGAGGIGGFFERTFAPKGLGRIYDELLANLAAEVEN